MHLTWSHAVVYVTDLAQMVDYYTNVLGFQVTDRGSVGDSELVFLSQVDTDHHQLAFVPVRQDTGPSNNVAHFAFRLDGLSDVKAMYARLVNDGRSTPPKPITHGNTWSLYFDDPEGNTLELFCDSPWHVQQPQGAAWDPSASDADIFTATQTQFRDEPGFSPIERYYQTRRETLEERQA